MPMKVENGYTTVTCDDPHKRGCTSDKGTIAAGEHRISSLEDQGWSVDDRTGIAICPMCRSIPFGGDEVSGKMTVEELFKHYEELCGRAAVEIGHQADDPMADHTLKHMRRYKDELRRRLKMVPKITAAELQPK